MQNPQPPEAGGSSIPRAAWIAMSAIGALIVVLLAAVLYKLSVPSNPAASAAASAAAAASSAQGPQSAVAVQGASPARAPAASFPSLSSAPRHTTSRTSATHRESGATAPTHTATGATRPADGQAQNFAPQNFPSQSPTAQPQAAVCHDCGTVASVTPVQEQGQANGVGAVVGGLVGGLLGNQVGGGNGRTAATVIGAVGGGLAGNEVQKRVNAHTVYHVQVRMDDGSERSITLSNAPPTGQRVRVNPDGSLSPL